MTTVLGNRLIDGRDGLYMRYVMRDAPYTRGGEKTDDSGDSTSEIAYYDEPSKENRFAMASWCC